MILNEKKSTFISNANFNETKMRMSDDPKLFMMLSSSIYEHKIRAVIRELSCNAQDSHIQAGIPNTPFLMHLPTSLEPWFSVEDFGVGLSKEEVEDIYTVYGESTKTKTNILTGALGLGSKSPYAYSDMFEVRTRKDGIELLYLASKNDKLEFTFNLVYEKPTDEPNGVLVKVPTIESDVREFRYEAIKVFNFFRLQPNSNIELGIDNDEMFTNLDTKGYHLDSQSRYSDGYKVSALMGNVAYDTVIDKEGFLRWCKSNKIDQSITDGCGSFLHLYNTIIDFPMGSLEFMPSRERLSLTRECLSTLYSRIIEVFTPTIESHKALIASSANIFDMYDKYHEDRDLVLGLMKYQYKGKEFTIDNIGGSNLYNANNLNTDYDAMMTEADINWIYRRKGSRGLYNLSTYGAHSYSDFLKFTKVANASNYEALVIIKDRKSAAGINKYISNLYLSLVSKLIGKEANVFNSVFLVSDVEQIKYIEETTNLTINVVNFSDLKALYSKDKPVTQRIKRENNEIKCVLFTEGNRLSEDNYTITDNTYYIPRLGNSHFLFSEDGKSTINDDALMNLSKLKSVDIVVLNGTNRVKLLKYAKPLSDLFKYEFSDLEYFYLRNKVNVECYIEIMNKKSKEYIFSWIDEDIIQHRESNKDFISELVDVVNDLRFMDGVKNLELELDRLNVFSESTGVELSTFINNYWDKSSEFSKEFRSYINLIRDYGLNQSDYDTMIHLIGLVVMDSNKDSNKDKK